MHINYGFVATSMALLFVLDITNTNSVSAAPGAELTRIIRTIRRRSLDVGSLSSDEGSAEGEPAGIRPTRQSGLPQLGLSAAMMQRISAGLVSSIAKFSADMSEGVEFPTQEEMTQAVDQALATSDYRNFAKVSQAIKNSIDALADRKLAEGKTGKSRESQISRVPLPNSSASKSAEQIATAILDTIHMFCEQKANGGQLPNASEVNQALTPALQNIDFSNVKKGAEAVKFGLDHMGSSKDSEVQAVTTTRRRSLDGGSLSINDESTHGEPTGIRPTHQSAVPQLGLSSAMMQRISAGLVGSIAKFSADMSEGVEFPTQVEMTQAVDQALATSDHTNFAKVAQAIKNSIDALADRKLAEGETGKSRESKISRVALPNSSASKSAEQIATALLDTIHMFCEQKANGGRLPNASEVNQALTPALQNIDFSNVKKGAEAVKFGLDHMGTNKHSQGPPIPAQTETLKVEA